jgi:hypothetical protein
MMEFTNFADGNAVVLATPTVVLMPSRGKAANPEAPHSSRAPTSTEYVVCVLPNREPMWLATHRVVSESSPG